MGRGSSVERAGGPLGGIRTWVFIAAVPVGSLMEWYDFLVSGVAASIVWPNVFYPFTSPLVGLALAVMTYGAGLVARPIGGIIWGHIADRLGRSRSLVYTLLLMGLATLAIGLLPGYDAIGGLAIALLVLFRILQGIAMGGEYGTINTWVLERAARSRFRALWVSIPQLGVPLAQIASGGVLSLLALAFPGDSFYSIGWRVAFYVGFVLAIIGVIIRRSLAESPLFERAKDEGKIDSLPSIRIAVREPRRFVLVFLASLMIFSSYYIGVTLLPGLLKNRGVPAGTASAVVLYMGVIMVFLYVFAGWLADLLGRRRVMLIGGLWYLVMSIPLFYSVIEGPISLAYLVSLLFVPIGSSFYFAPSGAYFAELFPVNYRASGLGVAYQLAGAVSGFLAPYIISSLYAQHASPLYLGLVNLVFVAISLIAFMMIREETVHRDIYYVK